MRLARIAHPTDGVAFASVDDENVAAEIADHPFGEPTYTGRSWPLSQVRLLAPILPSKVVAVGKNYADHAAEMNSELPKSPLIFLKPSTSVIGPGVPILLPPQSENVHFEGELAVVIGRPCRDVKAANAASVILGYTCANDVTARDLQSSDGQWTRAKGFDSFCPLGPWIETELDPGDVALTTEVDGEVKQDGHTADLVFLVSELIEFITAVMTLLPGDVILTGTPAGVGPITAGQTVSVRIEGIGTLTNPVAKR